MNDEFVNRLGRHRKTLAYLDKEENAGIWQDRPPKAFTKYVGEFRQAVEAFDKTGAEQGAPVSAEEQNREERELEDHAYPLSSALFDYLSDSGREADAAEWDITETDWRTLREQLLLGKTQRLIEELAKALAADPTVADEYNITAARIAALKKERQDYVEVIGDPGARRAQRAALTGSMRARMRMIDGLAKKMDRQVVNFRDGAGGKAFVEGYFAARRVDDLAGRASASAAPSSPPQGGSGPLPVPVPVSPAS